MVYSVSIQSGAQAPADPGARRDAPTLVFQGFPLEGEASLEDVSRALKVARRAVAYTDSDTDSDTDSTTEPEAPPSPVEDALEGFVKVEELEPQAEWREDTARKDEDPEEKETTFVERAPPPPPPRADAGTVDLVEEVLQADAELTGEGQKDEPPREPPAEVPVPRKPARRTKTHGAAPPAAGLGGKPRVVLQPPSTRLRRRRASVSVNELASDPARAREVKPKLLSRLPAEPEPTEKESETPNPAEDPPATPARGAKRKRKAPRRRRKTEPSRAAADPPPRDAPVSRYAVSEPETDAPPAPSGGSPGGPLAFAFARGSMPPPPPPPPAPADPAARARDALRHAKVLLDEACISPAEYEAVKRECLDRILWG
jgi:hypothetical protein